MPRQPRVATRSAAASRGIEPSRVEPVTGGHLGDADQADRQQRGLFDRQTRVLRDDLCDLVRAGRVEPFEALSNSHLVGEVGLEQQPVGTSGVVDEREVGGDRRRHAFLVVVGRTQRGVQALEQLLAAVVEQGEVEVELAREMLVEHRLADAGPLGDLVHGRCVVAVGDEHVAGGSEELGTARQPGQAHAAGGQVGQARHGAPRMIGWPDRTSGPA